MFWNCKKQFQKNKKKFRKSLKLYKRTFFGTKKYIENLNNKKRKRTEKRERKSMPEEKNKSINKLKQN